MDLLSDVLSSVHLKGTIYCQSELTAPWGLKFDGMQGHAGFFMVIRGGCYLEMDGVPGAITLAPGDLVMSPRCKGYSLRDSLNSAITPLMEVVADLPATNKILKFGGGGTLTTLVMGCFQFESGTKNPLICSLPEMLYIKAENLHSEPWLEMTLKFLASETATDKHGSTIAVSRLTDLLFIQAIRAFIGQVKDCPQSSGWLKAIADPQIGKALALIHEKSAAPWTVASLADAVGMSRSSFASKFNALTKTTPLEYVTSWRMQKAEELLALGEDNLSAIASTVGYQSESAFSKAFKRETGEAPGTFRRRVTLDSEPVLAR
jgi:AraC family transcriptional regulator, alkane utilization regulator